MSRSTDLASKLLFTAFQILKENDGELPSAELIEKVEERVVLDEWAKGRYKKSGYIRWQSILHFFSIDAVKAGWLIKKQGVWYLTPDGENALRLGEKDFSNAAKEAYKQWVAAQQSQDDFEEADDEIQETDKIESLVEEAQGNALAGISDFINKMDPYQFQDLAAALLRGMGYYTPFVAPKGKDGGIDVYAYKDPLGATFPHLKVQVKHREASKATSQELRQLKGNLNPNDDIGIFISTAGFTSDAKAEFRNSHPHIELIDLPRFIELWKNYYHQLSEADKALMPLIPVLFIAR